MRAAWCLGSIAATLATLGGVWACGSSSNGGGGNNGDAGGDGGSQAYTFEPQGCAYKVFVPETRAFLDFAKDDATGPGDAPVRVRIGLGGDVTINQPGYADPSTTAAFTWETANATNAAKVKLGTDPNSLTDVHAGFSWTTPPPTVGLGANEPSTYMHEVHVCGLTAGTTYYYQVGGGPSGSETWSATQTFTTVPNTGAVSIGLLGDARDDANVWQLAQQRMRDAAVNVQLIGGDIVDIGTLEAMYTEKLDRAWKDPQDATKFLTLGQQLMVPIAGNHENEAARFYANFSIPTGTGPYAETFASFAVGGVHVAMIDDEQISGAGTDADQAAAQLAWLDQDLAAADADRAKHPFVVVVSHRGLYSTWAHSADKDVIQTRAKLAPMFDKYHVDLAANGHDHEFEVTKPIHAGSDPSGAPVVQSAGQGTIYLITAGAGANIEPYDDKGAMPDFRDKTTKFGPGTPYVGVYSIATVVGTTLTVKTYGLKSAGGGVSGDDILDTITLAH